MAQTGPNWTMVSSGKDWRAAHHTATKTAAAERKSWYLSMTKFLRLFILTGKQSICTCMKTQTVQATTTKAIHLCLQYYRSVRFAEFVFFPHVVLWQILHSYWSTESKILAHVASTSCGTYPMDELGGLCTLCTELRFVQCKMGIQISRVSCVTQKIKQVSCRLAN